MLVEHVCREGRRPISLAWVVHVLRRLFLSVCGHGRIGVLAIFLRRAGLLDGFAWFVPCSVCGNQLLWVHKKCSGSCVGMGFRQAHARISAAGLLACRLSLKRCTTACARKLRTCGLAAEGRAVVMDTCPGCILWIRRRCSFAWLFGGAGDPFGVWRPARPQYLCCGSRRFLVRWSEGAGGTWQRMVVASDKWNFFLEGTVETLGLHLWHWFTSL